MVKSLLDTDILSEYLKGHNQTVVGHAARYAQQYGVFTFTSVTIYEIVYGFELKSASAQLEKALSWLRQNEEKRTTVHCLIAAVAVRLQMPLVTGNTEDFQAIQRTGTALTLENWRNAQA